MLTAIVTLAIFGLLVTVHEFGHFFTAKMTNMYVEEFSIGMGPLVGSKRVGETRYSLRALPLGGFVRVLGEDIEEEQRSGIEHIEVPAHRRYQNRPVWQRMIFAAAGSFMNLVTAVVIFALMFMVLGVAVPIDNPDTTISELVADGPAAQAGVQPGDKVTAINGQDISLWEELTDIVSQAKEGDTLEVTLDRNGTPVHVQIQPTLSEDGSRVLLGVYAQSAVREPVGPIKAIGLGAQNTWEMMKMMVDVLGDLFTGKVNVMDEEEGLTGPVGIVRIVNESTHMGWIYVFNLAALLSINLGIINLLPIPSLDGSKLLFLLVEGIRGKAMNPEREGYINLIGFALIMSLVLLVTFKDIVSLIR